MVLSMTACTTTQNTGQNDGSTTETTVDEAEVKKEKSGTEVTRIVSVDKVEDYVTIAQYKGIELENPAQEVSDEMVEARIAEILAADTKETQGSRAEVQNGDTVTISYVGTIDGKVFEGGNVTYYDWIVGSGDMFPAFEEGVIGMKRGETKKILCTFPEDYHGAELAGKEVLFTVTVQTIRRTATFDDDWAAANSDVATADEYKEVVRSELEASLETDTEDAMKSVAWENIVTNSTMIEYPEKDIETAKSLYNAQMISYAESYGMELEEFVESQGLTMEEYEEQCQLYAERKVKQNLIVQGIMDEENISLDDEECLEIQNQLMSTYGAESLAELIDMYSQVQIDESIALLRVENFIYENAVIVEPIAVVQEVEAVSQQADGLEATGEAAKPEGSGNTEETAADSESSGNAEETVTEPEGSDSTEELTSEKADIEKTEELSAESSENTEGTDTVPEKTTEE